MRANQDKKYQIKAKKQQKPRLQFSNRKMQTAHDIQEILSLSLEELYQRIMAGIQRLVIAIKYRFYQYTAGFFDRVKLPWFKLGLAALAIFIVTKKDIQFSINMQAPLGGIAEENNEEGNGVEEMSLIKTVSMNDFTPANSSPVPKPTLPNIDDLNEKRVQAYINRFSKVAATEMEKFGVPASVKMAQALLESRAGEHPDTRQSNNHFGAPMSETIYNSAWENWRAHSIFVASEYAQDSWEYDYKKWARGLEKAGYNSAKGYATKLIEVIDHYQLYQMDIR